MDLKRGTAVEITAVGYTGARGSIERKATNDRRDGTERFYVVFHGTFREIAFRTDEFRLVERPGKTPFDHP